jgi:hypothetical protein
VPPDHCGSIGRSRAPAVAPALRPLLNLVHCDLPADHLQPAAEGPDLVGISVRLGHDPRPWRTNVPSHRTLRYPPSNRLRPPRLSPSGPLWAVLAAFGAVLVLAMFSTPARADWDSPNYIGQEIPARRFTCMWTGQNYTEVGIAYTGNATGIDSRFLPAKWDGNVNSAFNNTTVHIRFWA